MTAKELIPKIAPHDIEAPTFRRFVQENRTFALGALGTLAVMFFGLWIFERLSTFRFKVLVNLEVEGEPIHLSKVVRCVTFTQGYGLGSKPVKSFVPKLRSFGAPLANGGGVFVATPDACKLLDRLSSNSWRAVLKPADPGYLPLIGWTRLRDVSGRNRPSSFEIYITRDAVTGIGRRVNFIDMRIEQPKWWEFESAVDEFGWFGLAQSKDMDEQPRRTYVSYYSTCLSYDDTDKYSELRRELNNVSKPTLLEGAARKEAIDFATFLARSSNRLVTGSQYLSNNWLDIAVGGSGVAPSPWITGGNNEHALSQDFSQVRSLIFIGPHWELGNVAGVLTFYDQPLALGQTLSYRTYPLHLKIADQNLMLFEKNGGGLRAVAVPTEQKLCLVTSRSFGFGPNAKVNY